MTKILQTRNIGFILNLFLSILQNLLQINLIFKPKNESFLKNFKIYYNNQSSMFRFARHQKNRLK